MRVFLRLHLKSGESEGGWEWLGGGQLTQYSCAGFGGQNIHRERAGPPAATGQREGPEGVGFMTMVHLRLLLRGWEKQFPKDLSLASIAASSRTAAFPPAFRGWGVGEGKRNSQALHLSTSTLDF